MPLILITTDRRDQGPAPSSPRVRPARPEVVLKEAVVSAVRLAGGTPLLLPPGALDAQAMSRVLAAVDGVVVSGGAFDIHPRHYGQAISARLDRVDAERTGLELPLCRACLDLGMPVLGVCGGMQALAVAAGGSLVQDIGSQVPGALEHEQPTDPAVAWHEVALTGMAATAAGPRIQVNSTHHQAVADAGVLEIVGRASDGVVEAIAGTGPGFALGVQWHPELLTGGHWPYALLIQACSG